VLSKNNGTSLKSNNITPHTPHLCCPEPPLCQLLELVPAPHQPFPTITTAYILCYVSKSTGPTCAALSGRSASSSAWCLLHTIRQPEQYSTVHKLPVHNVT
jgi:hypothetical protein